MSKRHNNLDMLSHETVNQYDNRINCMKKDHVGYAYFSTGYYDNIRYCLTCYIVWNGEINNKLFNRLNSKGYVVYCNKKVASELHSISSGIPVIGSFLACNGRLSIYDLFLSYNDSFWEINYLGIETTVPIDIYFRELKTEFEEYLFNSYRKPNVIDNIKNTSYSNIAFLPCDEKKHSSYQNMKLSSFAYDSICSYTIFSVVSFNSAFYKNTSFNFYESSYSYWGNSYNYSSFQINGYSSFNNLSYLNSIQFFEDHFDLDFDFQRLSSNLWEQYKFYSDYFKELSKTFGVGLRGFGIDLI